ncbi:inorganic phosphate transporter [Roseiterribacter gracilis]|uniref:Phosphate transporter n=1 Tax=Roseiterribacter gracilis TaxID=2812848 RepID=A0A8S8XBL0_9PROT|nr:phosphate transporter [Rhodospirillales bacterium TMPK1]
MSSTALDHKLASERRSAPVHEKLSGLIFIAVLVLGLAYVGANLAGDLEQAPTQSIFPFVLLGVALLCALGFEFVNGFHDTANAVATVIYTHSLPANLAVVWSGIFNFLGVLTSSGAVAFGIVSLLPVELVLQVGSEAGFAMVFALLIAAILWNLGTWYFGLPSSSSHTLIGSIIGVGLMNQLMNTSGSATSGVDWSQAAGIGRALLISPLVGFCAAALLLLSMKALVRMPALYQEPKGNKPPPLPVRALLVLTCTGVSFFHGSNDGQKGMGLIMLILIGTVPTAFALNRAVAEPQVAEFVTSAHVASDALRKIAGSATVAQAPRDEVGRYVREREWHAETAPALAGLTNEIASQVQQYGSLDRVPRELVRNVRNDMYLASEAIRLSGKNTPESFTGDTTKALGGFKSKLDGATRFIPDWVKVAVAIALGLGTMVGWKRIVVTVGEKIGKSHLTYAQGASAEIVAMGTIALADMYGLPVSTTHVLSSGVAGTMAANRSGLQLSTIRNIAMAWVLTLPASIMLSGSLYFLFRSIF